MPRRDEPVAGDWAGSEVMALVQTKPHYRVLATSSDRSALLREMRVVCAQVRETRGAPPHAWHIQRGVMRLG